MGRFYSALGPATNPTRKHWGHGWRIASAPTTGWEELLEGPVDACDVPGEHQRVLCEPAVDSAAQALQK
jgi:thioesterase domain-containing protein